MKSNSLKMKSKKRVLFIVPLPPPVHGSSVMCNYLKESQLINEKFDCDFVNLSTSRNTGETGKFMFRKIGRFISSLIVVFYKLISHHYDLCYLAIAFHKGILKDAPFVFFCKLFRRKVVLHLHGKGASIDAKKTFYRFLFELIFKNTKVILLSWLLYPDVEPFVKKSDVSICPNGIPVMNFKRRETENPVPHLLFLSNLKEDKGVIVLLDALKMLFSQNCLFKCDFVGGESKDLDEKSFQQEVDKRGLNGLVSYLGRKYGEEKEEAFEQADIFVFPTYYYNECFPLVLLEALQHALPVVTTNEGAITDIIQDGVNGYICERENATSLYNNLLRLIQNTELQKTMGENNMRDFHNKFTFDCFERNMTSILSQLTVNIDC